MNSRWKKRLSRLLCSILATALILPMAAGQVYAKDASLGTASVQYVDANKNVVIGTGQEYVKQRAGISSVVYNGNTYYDVFGGIRPDEVGTEDFIKSMLTTPTNFEYLEGGKKVKTSGSILEQWAQVAENLYVANNQYTMNEDKKYVTANDRDMDEDYCSIRRDLALTKKQEAGDVGDDNVCATGLLYAGSLKDVRDKMGDELARCVDGITKRDDYLKNASESGYPEALSCLKDDEKQPVYYSLLTWIDELWGTSQYNYQSYGLVFYDIKLQPFSPEGMEFITAATPYDSLEEASAASPDVTLKESGGKDNTVLEYFENASKSPSNVSLQLSEKKTDSVSNTVSSSKTLTFTQTLGLGWNWHLPGDAKGSQWSVNLTFSAAEAISTAFSDTKTATKEVNNTIGSSMTLPPHTAIGMEAYNTNYSIDLKYDLPVILQYKVAIVALSGECWDDGIASKYFGTAQYEQTCFETVFGGNEIAGSTAPESLRNRAITHQNKDNFEENYGKTFGYYECHGDGANPDTIDSINWEDVYGGNAPYVPKATEDTEVTINLYPVSKDGVFDPKSEPMFSYKEKVSADMEYSKETSRKYTKDGQEYVLYTDKILAADGKTDLNAHLYNLTKYTTPYSDTVAKSLAEQMYHDDPGSYQSADQIKEELIQKTHNINFYYYPVKNIDANVPDLSPQVDLESENVNDTADSSVQALDIKNAISWIAGFIPMSSDGGEIRMESKGLVSNIGDIVPLYPLKKTAITSNTKEYNLISGDEIDLSQIHVNGYDKDNVAFYGFDETQGYWEFVDENGMAYDLAGQDVIQLKQDKFLNKKSVVAGSTPGTVYLAYHINEDTYTYKDMIGYISDDNVTPAMVKVNVSEKEFDGTVKAEGTYTGYVADEAVEINNLTGLKGYALDNTDKKISGAAITWESQMDEEDGICIVDHSTLSFTKPGTYKIRALYHGKYSNWIEVTALEKRKVTKIDIRDEENVLAPFAYHNDPEKDTINLDALILKGIYDQYDNAWTEDIVEAKTSLDWYVNDVLVERNASNKQALYQVPKDGTYTIYAKYHVNDSEKPYDVCSDSFTLEVSGQRKLASLNIDSDTLKDDLGIGEPYAISLKDKIKVTALDQYGDSIVIQPSDYVWSTGEKYSKVEDGKLVGKVTGQDSIVLKVGDITSNKLDYKVVLKPYVTDLYTVKSDANATTEGNVFDLTKVAFEAKDLNGDRYTLSEEEKERITWTLTDEGTVKSSDCVFDETTKQITVSDGTLNYGETGNVILKAEFVNINGEKAVAAHVAIDVKQQPIIHSITLKQNGDRVLRTKENALLEDVFVVTGTDQYGKDYAMDHEKVTFASNNEKSFVINNENSSRAKYHNGGVIIAGKPDTKAMITASVVNQLGRTISSNGLVLEVPRVKKIASIEFTKVPESVAFDSVITMKDLGAICRDDKGAILTEEELAEYPATILYSVEAGETKARLDADTNKLTAGNHTGYINITAMTANSGSEESEDIQTTAKIWVGPVVDKITTDQISYSTMTQKVNVALTGNHLVDGMKVTLLDANGKPVAVATTSGNTQSQTASILLPAQADPTVSSLYTVSCSLGDSSLGEIDKAPSKAITVAPLKVGETFTSGIYTYRVTAFNKNGTANVDVTGFVRGKDVATVKILPVVKFKYVNCYVTGIAEKAFMKNKKITTVYTGANVVKIKANAFNACPKLKTIVVADKTVSIEKSAFYKCTKLAKITLGKAIKTIGAHAFCNDKAIKTIKVNSKVLTKLYGPHAFYGVKKVKLTVPKGMKTKYRKLFKKSGIKSFK